MRGGHHARSAVAILLALFPIVFSSAFGQGGRTEDNVLFPHPLPIPKALVGPDAGWGYWIDQGRFGVSDRNLPCVNFTEGKGHSPNIGVRAFIYLTHSFFVSPRFRYEPRPADFTEQLAGEPIRNQANEVVLLEQEGTATASFNYVCFDGMIGLNLFRSGFYLAGGGSVGTLLSSGYDYSERILSPPGIVYEDTKSTRHTIGPTRDFQAANKLNISLRGGAGYIQRIGRLAINPEVFYSRSLTQLISDPDAMDQQGVVVAVGLLWSIAGGGANGE